MARPLRGGGDVGKGLATKKKDLFLSSKHLLSKKNVATKLKGGGGGLSDRATKKRLFLWLPLGFLTFSLQRVSEKRKLAKLQSNLHLISSEKNHINKHTIFVDDEKE